MGSFDRYIEKNTPGEPAFPFMLRTEEADIQIKTLMAGQYQQAILIHRYFRQLLVSGGRLVMQIKISLQTIHNEIAWAEHLPTVSVLSAKNGKNSQTLEG